MAVPVLLELVLAERLVKRGEKVICFDLYPVPGKISHLGDRVKIVVGDITRIEDIIAAIREFRVERIVNLAYMLGAGIRKPILMWPFVSMLWE